MIQGSASPSNTHKRTALDDRRERSLAPAWLKAGVLGFLTHIAAPDGTLDPARTTMRVLCAWAYWNPHTHGFRRLDKRTIQFQLALLIQLGVLIVVRTARPGQPRILRLVPEAIDRIPATVCRRPPRKKEPSMPTERVIQMGDPSAEKMGDPDTGYVQHLQIQKEPVQATYAPAARASGFAAWWAHFPCKENRAKAEAAWIDGGFTAADLPVLLAALAWQVEQESWTRDGGRWIPRPWNYLRDRRWEDEPFVAPAFVERSKRGQANENAIRGFLNYYDHPDGPAQRLRDHGFDQHAENVWASAEAYAHQRR